MIERITTGDSDLDQVLHGGLPTGGLVVVSGPPGSGKTILAQQIAFANATDDHHAFYYSTLSESHTKLRAHLAGFDFYDDDAIGRRVHLLQLSEFAQRAQQDGPAMAAVIEEIAGRAYTGRASVIIVDSSKALHLFHDPDELRAATFELASKVSHSGAVLVYVGEYTSTDPDSAPEFAVADVILELANDPSPTTDLRTLRVAKLRGSPFIAGQHPVTITDVGFGVDIRMEAAAEPHLEVHEGRADLGHDQLDAMTDGGLPRGDVSLTIGPSGIGKTTLALHFTAAGLATGERALYFTLEEKPAELAAKADGFGLGFTDAIHDGSLQVLHALPGLTDLDHIGHMLRTAIDQHRPDRIVLDALSSLLPHVVRAGRSPAFQTALAATLQAHGATSLMTVEVQALGNTAGHIGSLSNLANNVLLQRYIERGSELGRVLSILKMRRSPHDKGLLRYDIGPDGLTILGEADNVRQITGWTVLTSTQQTAATAGT